MLRIAPLRCALLWMNTALLAQVPPPMPQAKPIATRPMPKPGEIGRTEAKPSAAAPLRSQAHAAPAYGTTPVPWPSGSTAPKDFPQDIPRVPGASLAAYSTSANTASAFFTCPQTPEGVAAVYLDFATREQWEILPFPGPPLERDRCVLARKGDWTLRVDAGPDPFTGNTEVFINVVLKPLPPPPKPKDGQASRKVTP